MAESLVVLPACPVLLSRQLGLSSRAPFPGSSPGSPAFVGTPGAREPQGRGGAPACAGLSARARGPGSGARPLSKRDVDCSTLLGPHSCSTARDGLPCLQPSLPDPPGRLTGLGKRCPHAAMLGCQPGQDLLSVTASGRGSPQLRLCRWLVFPTLQTAPEAPHRVAARPGAAVREGRGGTLRTGSYPQLFWADCAPGGPGRPAAACLSGPVRAGRAPQRWARVSQTSCFQGNPRSKNLAL